MDILRDLKTLTLPWSTKMLVIILLLAAVGLEVGVLGYSFWQNKRDEVSGAALQGFAAILPLILLTIVLAQADTGVTALQRRTELFHTGVVLPALKRIAERPSAFYSPRKTKRLEKETLPGRVLLNLRRGECYCDYLALVPWEGETKAVIVRLEVNVMRINFNLCIPQLLAGRSNPRTLFQHTLAGASVAGPSAGEGRKEPAVSASGYAFLDKPLHRTVEGVDLVCVVGSRFVGEEFLWNSAEQLYFAQDLTFMLRAFLAEAPKLFPTVPPGASPASLAELMAIVGGSRD